LGVNANTSFAGSQCDPRPYLWAADAFVMPSLQEGLGIAALEAIAAGTPAILTKVAGLDEVASHTRWTIACDPTAECIGNAIQTIMRLPRDTRISRAEEDSARIRAEYSVEKGVDRLIHTLYDLPGKDALAAEKRGALAAN